MKTVFVLAAVIGLSMSAASADCVGHKQVSASADTQTKVASAEKELPPAPASEAKEAQQAE